jgi:hypothetical protein
MAIGSRSSPNGADISIPFPVSARYCPVFLVIAHCFSLFLTTSWHYFGTGLNQSLFDDLLDNGPEEAVYLLEAALKPGREPVEGIEQHRVVDSPLRTSMTVNACRSVQKDAAREAGEQAFMITQRRPRAREPGGRLNTLGRNTVGLCPVLRIWI